MTGRLKWRPVVFTFSFSSKELKPGKDPLAPFRSRLEELDIKVTINYVLQATTHVIAGKRNTAKGLQALINGKYIVSEGFIDMIVYAATPTNLDEPESVCPLEQNFDEHWPDELKYLPAKSREPSERPIEDYAPDSGRCSVFEGYSFVFCDAAQFETLQAPICNGGGKAFHFKLEPGKTHADDIVRFVKNLAGEKGLGELEDGSEGKGVVVIKFRAEPDFEAWTANLDRRVAQALDLRLVEQSEFLEAILANDATMLRRPLMPGEDGKPVSSDFLESLLILILDSPPSPAISQQQSHTVRQMNSQTNGTALSSTRGRVRQKVVSRFKGYDHEDEDEKPPHTINSIPIAKDSPIRSQSQIAQSRPDTVSIQINSTRTSLIFEISKSSKEIHLMDVDSEGTKEGQSRRSPRKRLVPSSDPEDGEDLVDKLLPANTALKRRRIEEDANGISPDPIEKAPSKGRPAKRAVPKKEINVKEIVRERRWADAEAAMLEEDSDNENVEDMSIEEMKRLAVIEEVDLPPRRHHQLTSNGQDQGRWEDRWNGRKNFKKFRRKGDGAIAPRRGPAVIVPLEEAKKKDYGIGGAHPFGNGEQARQQQSVPPKRKSQTKSQSQHTLSTSTPSQPRVLEVPPELVVEDDGDTPSMVDLNAPRRTRNQEHSQQAMEQNSASRSQMTGATGKRPPTMPLGPPVVKRRKKFAAAQDSDSDG